jgi:hypothetical protein
VFERRERLATNCVPARMNCGAHGLARALAVKTITPQPQWPDRKPP